MKIIFCCTGNTCRSPIAEYLAKRYISEHNIKETEVSSCGVMCSNGNPISEMSRYVLKEIGIIDISHSSKQITLRELMEYDLVFVMTRCHRDYLITNYNAGNNVIVLGDYVGMGEVMDPYGGTIIDYRQCLNQLSICIEKLFIKLFFN